MKSKSLLLNIVLFSFFLIFSINKASSQIWINYDYTDGLIDGIISNIEKDADGNFWFSSWAKDGGGFNTGLSKFDGNNFTSFTTADGLPSDTVFALLSDSNNRLWVGTNQGLARYDGTNWITVNDNLIGTYVRSIFEDNDNNIWIASSNSQSSGWSIFDGNTWSTISESRGRFDIKQSADGSIWTCDNDGLHKYDGTNWTTYDETNGLSSNFVFDIFFDNENNLWVGNAVDSGLDMFDGTNWTTYTVADGLVDNRVRAFFQHPNGDIWFGTNAGISVFDGTNWTTYDENDGLIENHVRDFYPDSNGDLWIGTWGGVSQLTNIVSTDQIDLNNSISIYPNPTTSFLHIKSDNLIINRITIYDASGRNVLLKNIENNSVDLSSLENGIYLSKLEDNKGNSYTYKIVKE